MGIESNPNSNFSWFQMGAFLIDRVQIYIQAAEKLGVPFELIPNSDPRIDFPNSFAQARDGEQVIKVDYGQRYQEYWNEVDKISPPPPVKPKPKSP